MHKKITKAIIPVAGLGTRFLPATKAQPKEMMAVVDKPVIQFLVEEAVSAGIKEIIFVTGKNKQAIENHFDHAPELEAALKEKGRHEEAERMRDISNLAKFSYVRQKEPKGDGDAILTAIHLAHDEPVAILFGDDLIWGEESGLRQMVRVYEKYGAPVVALAEIPRNKVHRYGIVDGEPVATHLVRIRKLVEKPKAEDAPSTLAVIGKYIVTPAVIKELGKAKAGPDGELRLAHALDRLARKSDVYGLRLKGEWLDCGSKLGFLKATVQFGLEHAETADEFRQYLTGLKF